MPLNWRRGFNRVFVMAAVGWAGYILLVYPADQRVKAAGEYQKDVTLCAQTAQITHDYGECTELASHKLQGFVHGSSPLDALREREDAETLVLTLLSGISVVAPAPRGHGIDWLGALIVLGVLVLPPAAAYGLFRLGWLVLAWVMRGFRQAGG